MKKLAILFLSVFALGMSVTSCSGDDDKDSTPSISIVGKWEFDTMEGTIDTQTVPAGTPETIWHDPACTAGKSYWDIKQGTALELGSYDSASNCVLQKFNVQYNVDPAKSTLTVITPGGMFAYPIVKLTATELAWRENPDPSLNIVHHMIKK